MLKMVIETSGDIAKVADFIQGSICEISKYVKAQMDVSFQAIEAHKKIILELINFQRDDGVYKIEITIEFNMRMVLYVNGSQVASIDQSLTER